MNKDQCQHLWNLIIVACTTFDFKFHFCTTAAVRTFAWKTFDSFYTIIPQLFEVIKSKPDHIVSELVVRRMKDTRQMGSSSKLPASTVALWLLRLCPKPITFYRFICSQLTTILTLLFKLIHTI